MNREFVIYVALIYLGANIANHFSALTHCADDDDFGKIIHTVILAVIDLIFGIFIFGSLSI